MFDVTTNQAIAYLRFSLLATDTQCTVQTGQGAVFPASGFLVQIDDEIIMVGSRSGDVFSNLIRGQEATQVVAHSANSYVVNCFTAGMLAHLWKNIPDHAEGDVISTLSKYSDEFDIDSGTWTLTGSDRNASVDIGQTYRSYWHLQSAQWNGNYFYWKPATLNPPWKISAHMTVGHRINDPRGVASWSQFLYVSDQLIPTTSSTGTQMQIGLYYALENTASLGYRSYLATPTGSLATPVEMLRVEAFGTNNTNHQSYYQVRNRRMTVFEIAYDGATVTFSYGNGLVQHEVLQYANAAFSPQSLGLYTNCNCLNGTIYHAYADWVRIG